MKRPPAHEAPAGCVVVPRQVAGTQWRVPTGARACRMLLGVGRGGPRRSCRAPAVLELNRYRYAGGCRYDQWWPYCEDHTYGRWVEDDRVMEWHSVPVETAQVTP